MGGEVGRQVAEGTSPHDDREVFSEELSHAGIFLIYLIHRRNSRGSPLTWHVPLRSSRRGHIGTVVHELTLKMRCMYVEIIYKDDGATLDDLREAATTLEEAERTARRVLGGAHRFTVEVEHNLGDVRAALRAREGAVSAIRDAIAATTLGDT